MAETIAKLCDTFQFAGDSATLGSRWLLWLARFEMAVTASKLEISETAVKKATFLSRIGPEVFSIYDTLRKADNSDTLEDIIKFLSARFVHKGSQFAQRVRMADDGKRREGESIEEFVVRLRQLSQHCGFVDAEESITHQLIVGCGIEAFRRKVARMTDDKLALNDAIKMAKAYERELVDANVLARAASGRDSQILA